MKAFGRILALIARITLRNSWRNLVQQLRTVYSEYCFSMRAQMPAILPITLIAGEDRRFFRHNGVDLFALTRSTWFLVTRDVWTGGSTIEQQLVRTLTGRYERTLTRKVREIFLATLVNKVIPKSEIPGVYLSVAYFGWRMNGVLQACDRLSIRLTDVTAREAASIVARLKYPEPRAATLKRHQQILMRTEFLIMVIAKHFNYQLSSKKEKELYETICNFRTVRQAS